MALFFILSFLSTPLFAKEVGKGGIPANHITKSCKALPWGVEVWDLQEAISHLKAKDNILWIDTRPASFFKKGTMRGALKKSPSRQWSTPGNMPKHPVKCISRPKR